MALSCCRGGSRAVPANCAYSLKKESRMTTHALPQSPRLAALQHELERGNADALRAFWNALDTEGTPLVEPSDRAGMVLVTFIWRAAVETRNVVVFGSMDEGDPG